MGTPLKNQNFENLSFACYKGPQNRPRAKFSWTWVLKWLRLEVRTENRWRSTYLYIIVRLVIFCFQATGHSFSCRNMIFGLRELCTIGNWRLLTFFENSIFYGYMGHFFDFWAIFPYNFGDSWDIHGMRHIILGYYFPTIMMEIRTFHFRIPLVQGGNFSIFLSQF